jgi:hypothetical protein
MCLGVVRQFGDLGTGGADEFRVGAGVAAYSPSAFGRLGEQHPGAVSEGEVAGCRRDDAGELAHDGELLAAIQRAFSQWTALLARQLQETGVPAHRAGPIATATLAAMEGALILCRAERSQPLETTAQELMNLLPSQT